MVWGGSVLAAGLPFEPEVTPRQNRMLQQAVALAETNRVAAAEWLDAVEDRGPALAFAAGNFWFQAEEYVRAEQAYREALEALPRFRGALANLGRIYLLQERPADAITLYQQLVSDGQADADLYLLLGHALLMEQQPVSAEGAYRQSLLLRPQAREALTGLAKALFLQERFKEALALSGEILTQQPENRELWALRVNAYLQDGRNTDALHAIEIARRVGVADAELLATMGDLLLHADQPADALRIFQEALATDALPVSRIMRAIEGFLLTGDLASATAWVAEAENRMEEQDADPAALRALLRYRARIAWEQGNAEQARHWAQEVLRRDPLDGEMCLLLADMHKAAGEWEQALLQAERAERIEGMEAEALVQQALIQVERDRYKEAIALLEAAQVYREQPHVARYLEQLRRMLQP